MNIPNIRNTTTTIPDTDTYMHKLYVSMSLIGATYLLEKTQHNMFLNENYIYIYLASIQRHI